MLFKLLFLLISELMIIVESVLFSENFGCEAVNDNDVDFAGFGRNFHSAVFAYLEYLTDAVGGISRHLLIFVDVLHHDFTGNSTDFNAVGANIENPGSADIYGACGENSIAIMGCSLNLCCSGVPGCYLPGGAYGSHIFRRKKTR